MATDSAGRLVYTDNGQLICRVPAAGGASTCMTTPGGPGFVLDLKRGSDGAVWFLSRIAVGRVSEDLQLDIVAMVSGETLAAGADGNMWFVRADAGFGRVTPTGQVTLFPAANVSWGLAATPDGLWASTTDISTLIHLTYAGNSTLVPVSKGFGFATRQLIAGPDGRVWARTHAGSLERMKFGETPQTVVAAPKFTSTAFVFDSSGRLWFTDETSRMRIGTVNELGEIVWTPQQPIPFTVFDEAMAASPDGSVWLSTYFRVLPPAASSGKGGAVAATAIGNPATLVKVNPSALPIQGATLTPTAVPALSPLLLVFLAIALASVATLRR
jgi:streptogramin lyase